MPPRYQDWLKQAERDLKAAQDSLRAGNYEWAVFQALQAAEKALKAVLLFCGKVVRGHSLKHLYYHLKFDADLGIPEETLAELDRHYITTRYPNGFAEGYPGEYYSEAKARECINYARAVVEKAVSFLSETPQL